MRCKYCGMNTVYDTEFWAVVKDKRAHCWCQNCGAKVVFRLDADDYWLEDDPDVRLPIVAEELRRLRLENAQFKAGILEIKRWQESINIHEYMTQDAYYTEMSKSETLRRVLALFSEVETK